MRYPKDKLLAFCSFLLTTNITLFATEDRPNILFAIADDWGWPHAGAYEDAVVKTPTFDSIAENGALFQHAFVSSPSCTPSRNAILTGQHFWRLNSGSNLWSAFPNGIQTYPNILENNGYHVGSYRKAFGPGTDRERSVAGKKYQSVEAFFEDRPADKPFCFWLGSQDPHRVYDWQSGIKSGMKLSEVEVPPFFPDTEVVRTDICDYYWEVQRFDSDVGKALRMLEQMGELENTIVVMTGDHGWPFPRGKTNLYDHGVRVPLAVQWGSKITKNRIVKDFVSLTDLAPTFLEIAGVDIPEEMTGRSILPLLNATQSELVEKSRDHVFVGRERHTPAQIDHMGGYPMRAIRTEAFLYIRNFLPERWPAGHPDGSMRGPIYSDIDNGPTKDEIIRLKNEGYSYFHDLAMGKRPNKELYDLKSDPYQLNNLASRPEYKETVESLDRKLMVELSETGDPRVVGGAEKFDEFEYLGRMVSPAQ